MDINLHLARKFLVLIDGTPEHIAALRFAARRAHGTGGSVALLLVVNPEGFEQWFGVGNLIKEEAASEAQRIVKEAALLVRDFGCALPQTHICEGALDEEINRLIQEDPSISTLVLASGADASQPGPLISALAVGNSGFSIPVTIVPGSLSDDEIDALT